MKTIIIVIAIIIVIIFVNVTGLSLAKIAKRSDERLEEQERWLNDNPEQTPTTNEHQSQLS